MSESVNTNTQVSTQVAARPSYLVDKGGYTDSERQMLQYTKPPRFKIIQSLSGDNFKPQFTDGDGIIVPQKVKVCSLNSTASFVVTNFWTFYAALNPAQMTGQLNFIRDMTFDPKSELAKKAMKYLDDPCPENKEFKVKYRQFLNYIVCFPDIPEIQDIPVAMAYRGGQFKDGEMLNSIWQSRRAPLAACRFRVSTSLHKGKGTNRWFGPDFYNDSREWNTEEEYHKYKEISDRLEPIIQARAMELDLDDTDLGNAADDKQF